MGTISLALLSVDYLVGVSGRDYLVENMRQGDYIVGTNNFLSRDELGLLVRDYLAE